MFRSFFLSRKWVLWAYPGSALIMFVTWYIVKILERLNKWYGEFFNLIQKALESPGSVSFEEYYSEMETILTILVEYILIAVLLHYFTQHYVFRWRTAMNDYYTSHWHSLRHVEGAAQRIQDDTNRFARIVERLGSNFLESIMILFVFIPILRELSKNITELPWIGPVDASLVWLAILSAVGGTTIVALAGYRLPGLEFDLQRVEAAYRKELVHGEDSEYRAQPPTVKELFFDVRRYYFRYYMHYLYFNIGKYTYVQSSDIIPYAAMGPVVIAGTITFGVFQQIGNAFNRVERSFQYLIYSWDTIVELMSIYRRLKELEMAIDDKSGSQTMPPLYPSEREIDRRDDTSP